MKNVTQQTQRLESDSGSRRNFQFSIFNLKWPLLLALPALTLAFSLQPSPLVLAAPLGTAFTYQGRLTDSAQPATGIYDLRFTMCDLPSGGSPIAGPITNSPVAVNNGLFTVTLDFGEGVFTGAARWLEIGVRTNGSPDDFTLLAPRQPLTPAPYALYAPNAGSAVGVTGPVAASQLTGTLASSNIGPGTITAPQLASGAAFSNLYAGGQSGVALGGVVMSEDPDNAALINAGYVRLGPSSALNVTSEAWRSLASGPADIGQPIEGRTRHTAVWTGTEMIVWGGYSDGGTLNTGARYNPALDSWTAVSQTNAPSAREEHSAVWSGTQMIVWGGLVGEDRLNTGKRYNPLTDVWSSMSTINAPQARAYHGSIWSGNVMVVWGGSGNGEPESGVSYDLQDGGRYNPSTDTWTTVRTNTAPSARAKFATVWTGSEMVVWGGVHSVWHCSGCWICGCSISPSYLSDGGRYNPVTDTWSSVSTNGAPAAREQHSAIWTGTKMIIWGGIFVEPTGWGAVITHFNSGGSYDPAANTWSAVSTVGAPTGRYKHTAAWTGTRMVIWGGTEDNDGYLNTGGRYDPSANTWASVTTSGAPTARWEPTSVWTGSRVLVWGGYADDPDRHPAVGGSYNPANNTWTNMSVMPAISEPGARRNATALWTGSEMIIWGGENDASYLRSGGRYNPAGNSWTSLSMSNAPAARVDHTAVWTGTEMLVWGGYNGQMLGSGGRYNPALNTWSPISTNTAPSARRAHTAVWTGDAMIVWGGYTSQAKRNTFLDTGGRFDPGTDRWSQTSTNRSPEARAGHTAIWTGNEMVIWGGYFTTGSVVRVTTYLNSGARYRPDLDLLPLSQPWTSLATSRNTPSERRGHTAVWTGTEMIVWGGSDGGVLNTGASYRPETGSWTVISINGAPSARQDHTAVWTGTHMLIWGGRAGATEYYTGARYSPATLKWWPITTSGAPGARYDHGAVWMGDEMLIWGGYDGANCLDTIRGYRPPVTLYLYLKP